MRRFRPHLIALAITGVIVASGVIADRMLYTDVEILGPMTATVAIPALIAAVALLEIRRRRNE